MDRQFVKQRGYITLAQNSTSNYVRMAYALALSLKATQSGVSDLSIMVTPGTVIPEEYVSAFDQIIEIPWHDDAGDAEWKIHNKWKVYHCTPYIETILLDADMIFPTDVSHWWDLMDDRSVWFTTKPVTYQDEIITPGRYRGAFIENQLPMVYTAFAYFKQCDETTEFFDMVRRVYHNWKELFNIYHTRTADDDLLLAMATHRSSLRWNWSHFMYRYPREVSGDLAFSIATKILGKEDQYADGSIIPTFTHMKTHDFQIQTDAEDWTELFPCSMQNDLTLQVNGFRQRYPFHYVEKDWITDSMLKKLEDAARG
jgi:hypothetical protein